MAGFLTFVVRHHGAVRRIAIARESLLDLFDPAIYDGEDKAIEHFLKRTAISRDDCKTAVPFAPLFLGLIVLDIDNQCQYDAQIAGFLTELSLTVDWSWRHATKMQARGWLGQGLVRHDTEEIVAPYPPKWGWGWYEQQQEIHRNRFASTQPKYLGQKKRPTIHDLIANAPRAPFQPPGWSFVTVDPHEPKKVAGLRVDLKDAGFVFSPADDLAWSCWTPP